MEKYEPPNKSLQLSPWRSLGSVHAFSNSMLCWADAAAQLNSMLCPLKKASDRSSMLCTWSSIPSDES